jgi:hypothetical protein
VSRERSRREIDGPCKLRIEKMANAAEDAFAGRAILLDEKPATVGSSARVLSYEDIDEAQKKRDEKEAGAEAVRGRRRSK